MDDFSLIFIHPTHIMCEQYDNTNQSTKLNVRVKLTFSTLHHALK